VTFGLPTEPSDYRAATKQTARDDSWDGPTADGALLRPGIMSITWSLESCSPSATSDQWRRFLLNSGGTTWRARSASL